MKPYKKACFTSLKQMVIILILFCFCTPVNATSDNLIFIFDASSSMWGRIKGKPKFVIVREALINIIRELPDDQKVGLITYGSRREGDCNDVEELIPLSPLDRRNFVKTIKRIIPRGRTSLISSIHKAVDMIGESKEDTLIILLSDDMDACYKEPVAEIARIRESGVRCIINIIGVNVTDEEKTYLEAMAKAGSGSYYTVKTANDFNEIAKKTLEKTREPEPKPLTEQGRQGELKVVVFKNDKLYKAQAAVFDVDEKKAIKTLTSSADIDAPSVIPLDTGIYKVKITDPESLIQKPVKFPDVRITANDTTETRADFYEGILKVTVTKNGKPFIAAVSVFKKGEDKSVVSGPSGRGFRLLPGEYDVVVQDPSDPNKRPKKFAGIEIRPDEMVEKTGDFSEGVLKIMPVKDGEVFSGVITVFRKGENEPAASVTLTQETTALFRLPPGEYDVTVQDSDPDKPVRKIEDIRIEPGAEMEKQTEFISKPETPKKPLDTGRPGPVPDFDPSTAKYRCVIATVKNPLLEDDYTGFAMRDQLWNQSGGQIYIEYKPDSVSENEAELFNQVKAGNIQGMLCSAQTAAELSPRLTIFTLPFLFGSSDSIRAFVSSGKIFDHCMSKLERSGVAAIDVISYGYYGWGAGTPVKNIPDTMKMSFCFHHNAPTYHSLYKEWGLNYTVTPMADIQTALATEKCTVIADVPKVCLKSEGVKYYTSVGYGAEIFLWFFNKSWLNRLSPELRNIFKTVVNEVCEKIRQENDEMAEVGVTFIKFSDTESGFLKMLGEKIHKNHEADINYLEPDDKYRPVNYLKEVQYCVGYKP